MSVYLIGMSMLSSLFKLIVLLIVFILILAASYYATKWYAKAGFASNKPQNIHMVESFPMGPGKQICIMKLGNKYTAVAVCKDHITFLAELDEEQLSLDSLQTEHADFKEILGNMMKQQWKKDLFHKKEKKCDKE